MNFCKTGIRVLLLLAVMGAALAPMAAFAQEEVSDEAAAAMGCGCMIVMLIFWLAILALYIWSAIFVWKDAQARNMDNAVLWLILTLVIWPLGFIIYLIVRPK